MLVVYYVHNKLYCTVYSVMRSELVVYYVHNTLNCDVMSVCCALCTQHTVLKCVQCDEVSELVANIPICRSLQPASSPAISGDGAMLEGWIVTW